MITAVDLENAGPMPQSLLDGIGVALAFIDTDVWRVLHANHLFCLILQRPLDEILKAPSIFQFVHSDDRPNHFICASAQLDERAERSRFRTRYLRPDGTNFEVLATIAGVKNVSGEVRWITLILEEMAVPGWESEDDVFRLGREHVAFWSWMPESLGPGPAGGRRRCFGGSTMLPESMEDLMERVDPEDAHALQSLFMRSLKGVAGTQDYRLRDERGAWRWMREMVAPITDTAGNLTNVVGMSVEIAHVTSRKRCTPPAGVLSLVRHIEEHWDKPIELSDLMRQHGVSARSLHSHFGSLGTTPGSYLKRIRLRHAGDLLSEGGETTVAEVCSRCGFGNAGHFAKDYRSQFGELPSETLARARRLKSSQGDVEWSAPESDPAQPPPDANSSPDLSNCPAQDLC